MRWFCVFCVGSHCAIISKVLLNQPYWDRMPTKLPSFTGRVRDDRQGFSFQYNFLGLECQHKGLELACSQPGTSTAFWQGYGLHWPFIMALLSLKFNGDEQSVLRRLNFGMDWFFAGRRELICRVTKGQSGKWEAKKMLAPKFSLPLFILSVHANENRLHSFFCSPRIRWEQFGVN